MVAENVNRTQVCMTLLTTVNTRKAYTVQLVTEAGTAVGVFLQ